MDSRPWSGSVRTAKIALCLGSLALLAGTARAGNDARVAVQDPQGFLLPEAVVTWSLDGAPSAKAQHFGDGTVALPALTGEKVRLSIEHPFYGLSHVEVAVPDAPAGVVQVRIGGSSIEAKFVPSSAFQSPDHQGTAAAYPQTCSGQGGQLPDLQPHGAGGVLAASSDLNPLTAHRSAQLFEAGADAAADGLTWWGGYYDFARKLDAPQNGFDAFQVTYYADDAGGVLPGSVLAGPFAVTASAVPTGNVLCAGNVCVPEWQYSASHAPVALSAGARYWVEVVNATTGDGSWLWSASAATAGWSAQDGGLGWSPREHGLAFCVDYATAPVSSNLGGLNDDCADATPISGLGSFPFDNTNATQDGSAHPACLFFGSDQIDRDVWFCWTAPSSGSAVFETCGATTVDTKMAVYDGCTCPATTSALLACNDDSCSLQSRIQLQVVAGNTYLIRLGVFPSAAGGTGQLLISMISAPSNDTCATAIGPLAVPSLTSGTTVNATVDDDVPDCVVANTSPGVWYSVIGTGNTMTASNCTGTNFDSKISVYCGDCTDLTCIGGNDDACGLQSSVTWCSQLGATYFVLVHGFGGASGPFDLSISDNGQACTGAIQCMSTGACCLPNGCAITDAVSCGNMGGQYAGDGTSCGGMFYFPLPNCTKGFENIDPTGTNLNLGDDDGAVVPLPFTFNFFGVDRTSVGISSNGYLTFGPDLTDFSNDPLGDPEEPNDLIAPLWDDLDPSAGGSVKFKATGLAPNRAFIVQWTNVPQFATSDSNTFQVILFENANRISFRYQQVTPEAFAGDYTIGVENFDATEFEGFAGTLAVPGACLELVPESQTSACPTTLSLDILPGVCPNPFNSVSRGVLWGALLGTPSFDVSTIDVHTVLLSRADGVGAGVFPFEGPPGPFSVVADYGTPHSGLGPCHALGGDGIQDLSMSFRAAEVEELLELDQLPYGTVVPVVATGYLADGTFFEAYDALTLVPPPQTVQLQVEANLVETWIEVTPLDDLYDGAGWAPFERTYALGSALTLTAPTHQFTGVFSHWKVDGAKVGAGNPVLQLTLDQPRHVEAVYRFTRAPFSGFSAQ